MKALAIIPARGGSKGLPHKNVCLLAGKPLIGHVLSEAARCPHIDTVVVSTDDRQIGSVAGEFGAGVVWRPPELSGDTASSESALLHVLEQWQKKKRKLPELTVFLQCTSPLTLAEDIEGTIMALKKEKADCALAVTPFHYFLWKKDKTKGAAGVNHDERVRLRRQDRIPEYLETGAVYVMRTKGFMQKKHRFFGKMALYVMPRSRCLEIDNPEDLEIAENILSRRTKAGTLMKGLEKARAVVFDFDGVLTDNRVLVTEKGVEGVFCNRSDGLAISQLRSRGMNLLVLSGETNPVVRARCRKLGVECIQADKKEKALADWLRRKHLPPESVIYVGNDLNDLGCLRLAGWPVAVGDAHAAVKSRAKVVLQTNGGYGVAREIADRLKEREGEPPDAFAKKKQ
ncbi:MAG: acylneuraminate cytidylyltransferase [Verrucomicrobiae bacterium]|nr:acylneuraminate cytidylyltransferase [Verrucomicrobiae bacterium]